MAVTESIFKKLRLHPPKFYVNNSATGFEERTSGLVEAALFRRMGEWRYTCLNMWLTGPLRRIVSQCHCLATRINTQHERRHAERNGATAYTE